MTRIYCLDSADYELYLGENYLPEEEVLIRPTEQLLACCRASGTPLTLFADVACLWRYQELGREDFPAAAATQLRQAVADGHDVQAHWHNHWLTAQPEGRAWHFDPATYPMLLTDSSTGAEREQLLQGLRRMRCDLETMLQSVRPGYCCVAFRAGGYCLEPDPATVLNCLEEAGFRLDSSIVPGLTVRSAWRRVDFRQVPELPFYRLGGATGLQRPAPSGSGIHEIPITACVPTMGQRHLELSRIGLREAWRIVCKTDRQYLVRGRACEDLPPLLMADRWRRAWWRLLGRWRQGLLRLELQPDVEPMQACVTGYLARFRRAPVVFLVLNAHPKGVDARHLTALTRLHDHLRRRYRERISWITFQQAVELLDDPDFDVSGNKVWP